MGLAPNIEKKKQPFVFKTCKLCKNTLGPDGFVPVRAWGFSDGYSDICDNCLENFLQEANWDWEKVDYLCQIHSIPFIPKEWERIKELNDAAPFKKYAEVFLESDYKGLNWGDYFQEFTRLKEKGELSSQLPEINEEERREQRARWGHNYDDEALDYLESLYNGLLSTQNVNGRLQGDQAIKLCKISYEIDQRIAENSDFDKLLSSYDKLVKIAEFTPKNVKNLNDFDTCGELVRWLEKKGWKNSFYDDVTRDIVDETIKNIQSFNQRLYINETGIGDEINHRIENLKSVQQMENYYDTDIDFDNDNYENSGYEDLFKDDNEEFEADLEDGNKKEN